MNDAVTESEAARPLRPEPAAVPAADGVPFVPFPITRPLLVISDILAALMLGVDVLVVAACVIARVVWNAPVEWADDVARGLMVGSTFFGAASAMARCESLGIGYFVDRFPHGLREAVDATGMLLMLAMSIYVAAYTIDLSLMTTGQTTGSGLPLEWTFYPMGGGMVCMSAFVAENMLRRPVRHIVEAMVILGVCTGGYMALATLAPDLLPSPSVWMLIGLAVTLFGGMPIGFVLVLAAMAYLLTEGSLPGVIVAQQMARGIDSFVMLAVPSSSSSAT